MPENISKISTGRKHNKSQKSSAFKLLSQLGYRARTPQVLSQDGEGSTCDPPPPQASRASYVSKPGGLSNRSLECSSFPEARDENLPRAALPLSHVAKNSVALRLSLKKSPETHLYLARFPTLALPHSGDD